jgi:hypothetical protein
MPTITGYDGKSLLLERFAQSRTRMDELGTCYQDFAARMGRLAFRTGKLCLGLSHG